MIAAAFIVNKDGTILIEKQYRDHIPRTGIESACLAIQDKTQTPPGVIPDGDYTTVLHHHGDIWFVGVCEGDEFALFALSVLKSIARDLATLLTDGLTELSIKNEYTTVYQILDYAVDFGFPFMNESNTINTVLHRLPPDPVKGIGRIQLDFQRPWRSVGVKYSSNEFLIDVVETVDLTVSEIGRIEFCHIRGSVNIKCRLSGNPHCSLVLSGNTHYEDIVYHRCVETEGAAKVIPFVPPDGPFTLMQYRTTTTQVTAPLWLAPKFNWSRDSVTFEVAMKPTATAGKALERIEIRFELPTGVNPPSLSAPDGKATYETATREVVWTIPSYSKSDATTLRGSASVESGFVLGGRHPVVSAKFATTGTAPSGFKVEKTDVEGVQYKMFKGVKYIVLAGDYEFKSGA